MTEAAAHFSAVVVGAGPAGLMAALTLARGGLRCLLLERNTVAGKKLLVSGQGRCNLTQKTDAEGIAAAFFDKTRFVKSASFAFSPDDTDSFFKMLGVPLFTREDGKVFPKSESSVQVRDALVSACREAGVTMRFSEQVKTIERAGPFVIRGKREFTADAVILACGGASYPVTGSDGSAYALARALGHTIVPPRPALAGVRIADPIFPACAGISFDDLLLTVGSGKSKATSRGAAVCTHHGLSGPAVLRFSRSLSRGDTVHLNFYPAMTKEQCVEVLCGLAATSRNRQVKTAVAEWVAQRLAESLVVAAGVASDAKFSQCSRTQLIAVAERVCAYPCVIAAVSGFGEAMATRGGVATDEIDAKTMQSRLAKGLYFAGEFMDIDGDTGGYNIQMAFATGVLAARSIIAARKGDA